MQYFVVSKQFKVILLIFAKKKQKLRNSIIREANLIFSKKKNICSPGDETAMVLWYPRFVSNLYKFLVGTNMHIIEIKKPMWKICGAADSPHLLLVNMLKT